MDMQEEGVPVTVPEMPTRKCAVGSKPYRYAGRLFRLTGRASSDWATQLKRRDWEEKMEMEMERRDTQGWNTNAKLERLTRKSASCRVCEVK